MSRKTAGTVAWIALLAVLLPSVGAQGAVVLGNGVDDGTTSQTAVPIGIATPYSVSTGTSPSSYTKPLIAYLPSRAAGNPPPGVVTPDDLGPLGKPPGSP